MIEGKKGLDYSCDPEEGYQSGNKKEHLPGAYFRARKMAFCEYNTCYQEDSEFQQLENLKPGNVVDES